MQASINRRDFLKRGTVFTAGLSALAAAPALRAAQPNSKVRVAVIGCNARGMAHIAGYLALPNVEIACICDVDSRALEKGIAAVAAKQSNKPRGERDLRRVFDDPGVDAISIATPDHWHAPATILACAAGKHVYVEKPGSHNLLESEWIVAAARKHRRVVQMGNQRRSWPWVIEAMAALHAGEIGDMRLARAWYANRRPPIGKGKPAPVPDWLDYGLWQGPAPEQAFRDHWVHYNWHWFWNWGTGELGNNGVHALDLARWGMQVELPTRITCGGGRYHYPDEWETPDTIIAGFDFGDKGIVWEGQSCDPRGFEGSSFGVTFHGNKGSMVITNDSATIYDPAQKMLRKMSAEKGGLFGYDTLHFGNFIDAIRDGKALTSDIGEGQKSTTLCHLGNIAWRTGHVLAFDSSTRKIMDDPKASALTRREYQPGWTPAV